MTLTDQLTAIEQRVDRGTPLHHLDATYICDDYCRVRGCCTCDRRALLAKVRQLQAAVEAANRHLVCVKGVARRDCEVMQFLDAALAPMPEGT